MKGKRIDRIFKICGIALFLIFVCVPVVSAQQCDVSLPELKDPNDIGQWLSSSVRYRMKFSDSFQLPSRTLELRSGDCKDMAVLVSAILSRQNIDSEIVIISFKGIPVKHAICAWQGEDGSYYFSSNNKVHSTGYPDLKAFLERHYPDWEKASITDSSSKYSRVIRRT